MSGHQIFDVALIAVMALALTAKVTVLILHYNLRMRIWRATQEPLQRSKSDG